MRAFSTEELRAEVRAALGHVLGEVVPPGRRVWSTDEPPVVLRTDAELATFVRRVATLCDDPVQRADLRSGRRRFRLAAAAAEHPPGGAQPGAATHRIEHGAVTERTVRRARADGARLVLGRRAVLTPLARDTARSLGVEIEKER